MKLKTSLTLFFMSLLYTGNLAQTTAQRMSLDEVVQLALENHSQLKLSRQNIQIARQQTRIAGLQKLPSLSASANAFYLGDALVLDKDLSKVASVPMPHFGNTYGVQASELIFKGSLVKKSIEMSQLREQLAALDYDRDEQNIKFLVTSAFLDIEKILNQKNVYINNLKLATERLENVRKFYKQGMVTRNEVIRGELMLKNLQQGIVVLDNSRAALNYQLATAIGIPTGTVIQPEVNEAPADAPASLDDYLALAYENHPALKSALTGIKMANKNIEIIRTDKMPAIAAFGGYNMARPATATRPAQDLYTNTWQTGLSVTYNIDNLYKTREKEQLGKFQLDQAAEALELQRQNIAVQTNAAFLKWQEALQQAQLYKESEILANENYRIIEAKYLNQLALQADMTDASNAKLEAELQYANSQINVLYQYYNLLKTTGTL